MSNEPNYPVKALARALSILEALLQHHSPLSITQLSQRLGLYPSSVHRMVDTLKYWGLVEQLPHSQEYTLGLKVVQLGMAKLHQMSVFNEARPLLEKLCEQFNETVNLGVLDHEQVVYLDKYESTRIVKAILYPGRRAPIYCTAIGKVLLAFQKNEQRKAIIKQLKLKKYTQNTITNKKILVQELAKIRYLGYAFDYGEQVEEVNCIAAPVFNVYGNVMAALSVSVPVFRINKGKKQKIIYACQQTAQKISLRLGYQPQKIK